MNNAYSRPGPHVRPRLRREPGFANGVNEFQFARLDRHGLTGETDNANDSRCRHNGRRTIGEIEPHEDIAREKRQLKFFDAI